VHGQPACAPLLAQAGLSRFLKPYGDSYALLEARAREAEARGYAAIR